MCFFGFDLRCGSVFTFFAHASNETCNNDQLTLLCIFLYFFSNCFSVCYDWRLLTALLETVLLFYLFLFFCLFLLIVALCVVAPRPMEQRLPSYSAFACQGSCLVGEACLFSLSLSPPRLLLFNTFSLDGRLKFYNSIGCFLLCLESRFFYCLDWILDHILQSWLMPRSRPCLKSYVVVGFHSLFKLKIIESERLRT